MLIRQTKAEEKLAASPSPRLPPPPLPKKDAPLIRSKLMMEIGKDYTVCGEFILTPEMSNALVKRRKHKNKPARSHHIPRKAPTLPSPPSHKPPPPTPFLLFVGSGRRTRNANPKRHALRGERSPLIMSRIDTGPGLSRGSSKPIRE